MVENNAKTRRQTIIDEIIKNTLFILTIAIVVLCMPKDSSFPYEFEQNKPWQYGELNAPFQFPIYKMENELLNERKAILERHTPYYDRDSLAGSKQIELLQKHLAQATETNTNKAEQKELSLLASYLREQMTAIYNVGIVSNEDFSSMSEKNVTLLFITHNNISKSYVPSDIFTPESAWQRLQQALPAGIDPALMERHAVSSYLQSNLVYNAELTNSLKNKELEEVCETVSMVQAGERIIDRGEIVTAQRYQILLSFKRESEERMQETKSNNIQLYLGQTLLVICLILLFYLYTRMFRKQFYANKRYVALMLLLIVAFVGITALNLHLVDKKVCWVYAIPYALLPIIVSTFFDTRTGLYSHIITVLICSLMVPQPFVFLMLQVTAGMVTINSLSDLSNRAQIIHTAALIILCYCLMYLGYTLTMGNGISQIEWKYFYQFAINGALLLFAYPLIFIIEKVFGFVSNVTLIELSNINNPLLRQLSEAAPGTFQHSLQVSNLAAEIARKVGGNPLLARTGALYHDIGKAKNPAFFTENQGKTGNPHDQLSPEDSANIIMRHVTDGITMGHEANLPDTILEFIASHHGNSKVRYFYNTWINNHPNETVNESLFTYLGPNPNSKEQAIVMICDSIEAASRSLKDYTDESISQLVDKITDGLVAEHHLDNTPLTLQQITRAKDILKERLKNIYHTRIAYPELKQQ